MTLGINGLGRKRMDYLFRLVTCLFFVFSFNTKAMVISGCTIEDYTQCAGTDFSNTFMNNPNLRHADLQSTTWYQAYITNGKFHFANLAGSDLSFAIFSNAKMNDADLRQTTIESTDLYKAKLIRADFRNATFSNQVNVFLAEMSNSDLRGADFGDTDLSATFLYGAKYDENTIFPSGFDPSTANMVFMSQVPLPAGITLFLSGLVGLVGVKLRGL